MSLEDLERAGVMLPRNEWGKREVRSAVNKKLFLAATAISAAAFLLMYYGNGRAITWLGSLLFFIALFDVTWIALRATEAHCRQPGGHRG